MQTIELLNECVDALRVPTWDCNCRGQHIRLIDAALNAGTERPEVEALLRQAADIFRRHEGLEPLALALVGDEEANSLAAKLDAHLGDDRFVYHGTIAGRLSPIREEGLIPRRVPVWNAKDVPVLPELKVVFFDRTWRGAMSWAEAAHARSRGRRNSLARQPAVIRRTVRGLNLRNDVFSTRPNCLMVDGEICMANAEVFIGRPKGMPQWAPIDAIVRSPINRG